MTSFRPLAGIRVFRTGMFGNYDTDRSLVSVPWRGLGSFGRVIPIDTVHVKVKFPSPGGD